MGRVVEDEDVGLLLLDAAVGEVLVVLGVAGWVDGEDETTLVLELVVVGRVVDGEAELMLLDVAIVEGLVVLLCVLDVVEVDTSALLKLDAAREDEVVVVGWVEDTGVLLLDWVIEDMLVVT